MSNKLKTNQKKQEDSGERIMANIIEYALAVVGAALCILLPLYLKDGYHSVGTAKYQIYQVIMRAGFAILLVLTIAWLFSKKEFQKAKLSSADLCMLAFLILCFVAAIAGGNFQECIEGYSGWNMGLLAMASFGLLYFYFSRFGRYYQTVFGCLLATTFIVFVIGILHRLLIDPIGVYADIADTYKNQFLSTLGQATWYSSFVCTVLPLGVGVFWCAKKKWLRIVSGIFTFAGFCTMITQNSDSAYAALVGFFAVFFWFSVSAADRMERFAEILLLFVLSTRFMYFAFLIRPNQILTLDTFSHFCIYDSGMWPALLLAILFWAALLVCAKKGIYHVRAARLIRAILFILGGLVVAAAGVILIMSAKGILPESLAKLTSKLPYLTWSDNWGNGRGRTWAFSLQMFGDMDVLHKLFGVGPDGYAPYAYSFYQERLTEMWGDRTLTNAHNEWMNALINYGVFGAAAYIGIFVTTIKSCAGKLARQPMMTGIIACIVSYMCHNFFCYQQVCCTPFVFMIIGVGNYLVRRKDE